jgi:hypothetical protein
MSQRRKRKSKKSHAKRFGPARHEQFQFHALVETFPADPIRLNRRNHPPDGRRETARLKLVGFMRRKFRLH